MVQFQARSRVASGEEATAIHSLVKTAVDTDEPSPLPPEELAGALALREQAMAVLAHELRNPLSAIHALARAGTRREQMPPDVGERLLQMERAAKRSLAMLDSLLVFSEGRWRGLLSIEPVPTLLAEIASGVIEELQAANPTRDIALEVKSRAPFTLDPLRMGQVMSNLISNAMVHGFRDSKVWVAVDVSEREALVAVRNRGPVIPAEEVPSLFEAFKQGRRNRGQQHQPRGLGLGLYIVKLIVAAHDGTVAVESDAQLGTTFVVRLPRRPD